MRKFLTLTLVCSAWLIEQSTGNLASIKKVFIDKMDNELDQYIRAEISKQFNGKVMDALEK